MSLDKLFWIWFAFTGFISVYILMEDSSPYAFIMPLLVIGLGLERLADERKSKTCIIKSANKLLKKLQN